jgi:hypothetical protein
MNEPSPPLPSRRYTCRVCGSKYRRGNKPKERLRDPICPPCEKTTTAGPYIRPFVPDWPPDESGVDLAGKLLAFIKVNHQQGTLKELTDIQLHAALQPYETELTILKNHQ